MAKPDSPVREYRVIIDDSGMKYVNRILIGTATTGLVRMEWHGARSALTIPCNWSQVGMTQFVPGYIPLGYTVADAQNKIVQAAVKGDFEWLLLYEHDMLPPADLFIRLNDYMHAEDTPVVSGLYFTRSVPSEPILYRGRGTSYYTDWKLGDKVWVDGVPTGMLLIHCAILREMWEDAEEYQAGRDWVRRVFDAPRDQWFGPDTSEYHSVTGTTDLAWCTAVMQGDYLRKAGWGKFADEHPDYPFLVDTNIFCRHIDPNGQQYPHIGEMAQWKVEEEPPALGVHVSDSAAVKDRLG